MRCLDLINNIYESSGLGKRGQLDSSVKAMILDMINLEYGRVYSSYPWDDVKLFNLSATTTDGALTLPAYVDLVRGVRIGNTPLFPVGELHVNIFSADNLSVAGVPYGHIFLASSPVLTQPASATTIKLVSSSTSDNTSFTVRIEGLVGGFSDFEEIALNGTTTVTTTKTFDAGGLFAIIKNQTTGWITIKNSASVEIGRIAPAEYQSKYRRLQLHPIVSSSTTVTLQCARKFELLLSDNDSICIERAETAVLDYARSRFLDKIGNQAGAKIAREIAADGIELAIKNEELLNNKAQVIIPLSGLFACDDENTFRLWDTTKTGLFS